MHEIIWRTTAPIDNVLVLALAAAGTVPVGHAQTVVDEGLAVMRVFDLLNFNLSFKSIIN